jgi:hypothetical protein
MSGFPGSCSRARTAAVRSAAVIPSASISSWLAAPRACALTQSGSTPASTSRRLRVSFLESVRNSGGSGKPGRTTAAQTTTGPAHAPRPTSSTPATTGSPDAASSRSIS